MLANLKTSAQRRTAIFYGLIMVGFYSCAGVLRQLLPALGVHHRLLLHHLRHQLGRVRGLFPI